MKKITPEIVQKLLDKNNLIWVDKIYINCDTPLDCICKICDNKCNPRYTNLQQGNMPDGKVYYVDFYLKEQDIYVEVKGRKFPKSMEKWDWFHREYPNSELWNKEKLKEMKIL